MLLMEAFGNKPGFVLIESAIRILLDSENPFTPNGSPVGG
jgi:hypothetical protein